VSEVIRIQGRGIKVLGNRFVGRDGCVQTVIRAFPPASGTGLVSATVKGNTIFAFLGTGVRGEGERTTLLVRDNSIYLEQASVPDGVKPVGVAMVEHVNGDVTGNAIGRGTQPSSFHAAVLAEVGESLLIDDNLIGDAIWGIRLSFVQLMTVTNNTISLVQRGIFTDAFTNSTVQDNTVSNSWYGIYSGDNTFNPDGNNLFKGNVITSSLDYGCYEEVGPEDGVEANVWTQNSADSANLPLICPAG
jgi:parallel beta-helix repeat protein